MDKYYFNLCRFANIVSSNSLSKIEYIKENFSFLKDKTYFIPNISNTIRLSEPGMENYFSNNISYVGRISPEKNIDVCIEAFAKFTGTKKDQNIHFNIYGEANNIQYLNKIKNLISELKMDKYIFIKGPINNVNEVYKRTKAICLFSSYEGFSNVLSEALANGVPMIVSNIIENKYLVENEKNGYTISLQDTKSIHFIFTKLFSLSQDEYKKIQKNNLTKSNEIFDLDRIYNLYSSLLN
ncbi:MAG: glycosyltransferase [Saprospiraceae bacterium]|nr:glycosyltransferase [Saprospiraceae bacterium]